MKRTLRQEDADMEGEDDDEESEEQRSQRRSRSAYGDTVHVVAPGQMRAVAHHVARARRDTLATLAALRAAREEEQRRALADQAGRYPLNDVLEQAHHNRMLRALAQAEATAAAAAHALDAAMDADL